MIAGILATPLVNISIFIVDGFCFLKRLSSTIIVTRNSVMSLTPLSSSYIEWLGIQVFPTSNVVCMPLCNGLIDTFDAVIPFIMA